MDPATASAIWVKLLYAGLFSFVLLLLILLAELALKSPWGRMMRAIRDNELAAAAMGKQVEARRLQAFVFGSALTYALYSAGTELAVRRLGAIRFAALAITALTLPRLRGRMRAKGEGMPLALVNLFRCSPAQAGQTAVFLQYFICSDVGLAVISFALLAAAA